jgi:hypothetical protein
LHFTQIFLTDALTFMTPSSPNPEGDAATRHVVR